VLDHDANASDWVVRFAALVIEGGTVLDVAAGSGRHARWFEERGHRVTAIDRDAEALDRCGATEPIVCDLESGRPDAWPVAGRRYAAVVVTRYLHRPLFPQLVAALGEGGVLIYETFARGNGSFGKPDRPDFLLEPGELLDRCRGLCIVAYEDGLVSQRRPASIQRICAVRAGAADRFALDRSAPPGRDDHLL
jgi:SAM-dependent methyltransferase